RRDRQLRECVPYSALFARPVCLPDPTNLTFPTHPTFPTYLNHVEALDTGRVTRNLVPLPSELCTSMRPSCASTILRTIGRPSPDPWGLVVKNGSKIRSHKSGATPGPSSTTSTTIVGVGGCDSLANAGSWTPGSSVASIRT